MRSLRFGVTDGARYAEYWKVTASAGRAELVVAGNRTGRFFHLTMHEDEAFWHLKLTLPEGITEQPWRPPTEVLPGVRRLIRLLIPLEAVRHAAPRRAGAVTWLPAPADDQSWAEFTILHCTKGRPEIRSATLLGGVVLADGSEAFVIARETPSEPGSFTVNVPNPDEARRTWIQPGIGAWIHGARPDGCLWFLQLHSTPRDEGRPADARRKRHDSRS